MYTHLQLKNARSLSINQLDDKVGLGDEEANLQLVQALAHNLQRLLQIHVGLPVTIEDRQNKVGAISVSSEFHLGERGHVVHVVQGHLAALLGCVVAG